MRTLQNPCLYCSSRENQCCLLEYNKIIIRFIAFATMVILGVGIYVVVGDIAILMLSVVVVGNVAILLSFAVGNVTIIMSTFGDGNIVKFLLLAIRVGNVAVSM